MEGELDEFENRLRSRPGLQPTYKLRDRVIGSVTAELALKSDGGSAPESFGSIYWAAAAVALVMMGFSMVITSQDGLASSSRHRGAITADISAIRQIENQSDGSFK
jgi:hypothetical protein